MTLHKEEAMRKPLIATQGHVLTDGTTYRKIRYLAEGTSESDFYEITDEEYNAILAKQESSEDNDEFEGGVTEADYQSALEKMGVKL